MLLAHVCVGLLSAMVMSFISGIPPPSALRAVTVVPVDYYLVFSVFVVVVHCPSS